MASAHIEVGSATRLAGQLLGLVDSLQAVKDNAERAKATYDQLALGGDWVALGAALNINATDAEAVYNILGSVVTEINGTFIQQFLGRLG